MHHVMIVSEPKMLLAMPITDLWVNIPHIPQITPGLGDGTCLHLGLAPCPK